MNFAIPFSGRMSIRSSSGERAADTESCKILTAILYRLSTGSHVERAGETPFCVGANKPVCFFIPNNKPVRDIIRKKTNKKIAIFLWSQRNHRIHLACCFVLIISEKLRDCFCTGPFSLKGSSQRENKIRTGSHYTGGIRPVTLIGNIFPASRDQEIFYQLV